MGGLVEDLLLLAELDRGRPLRAEPVDLHRICTDAVDDSNAVPHGHQLTLQPGPPVVVVGDDERLAQVAHNLVRNALAHTPPGTEVVVSTGVAQTHGIHQGDATTARASRRPWPAGSSTASTRATRPAPPRAPGSGWPSCGPSPRRCTARRRWRRRRRAGPASWSGSRWPPAARPAWPLGAAGRRSAHRNCTEAPGSTASSTVASFTSASAASASGSESATIPPPARSVSVAAVGVELGAADADHPLPVAVGADPAHRSGPVAPFARLVVGDEGQGVGARACRRRPASDGGVRRSSSTPARTRPRPGRGVPRSSSRGGPPNGRRPRRARPGTDELARRRAPGRRRCPRRRSGARRGSWPTRPGRAGRRRRPGPCRPAARCRPVGGSRPGFRAGPPGARGWRRRRSPRGPAWRRWCSSARRPAAGAGPPRVTAARAGGPRRAGTARPCAGRRRARAMTATAAATMAA